MKKVIALTAALGLSALGMACGGADNTNVNVNAKPANVANVAPASSPVTVASPINTAPSTNATNGNSAMGNSAANKSGNTTTNTASNTKTANTTASPAATKKP
jgi:hypothetical protein